MEHFQATLDPRKQELLEARFLGARVSVYSAHAFFLSFILSSLAQKYFFSHHRRRRRRRMRKKLILQSSNVHERSRKRVKWLKSCSFHISIYSHIDEWYFTLMRYLDKIIYKGRLFTDKRCLCQNKLFQIANNLRKTRCKVSAKNYEMDVCDYLKRTAWCAFYSINPDI